MGLSLFDIIHEEDIVNVRSVLTDAEARLLGHMSHERKQYFLYSMHSFSGLLLNN